MATALSMAYKMAVVSSSSSSLTSIVYKSALTLTSATYTALSSIEESLICNRGKEQIHTFPVLHVYTFFFEALMKSPMIIPANIMAEREENVLIIIYVMCGYRHAYVCVQLQ